MRYCSNCGTQNDSDAKFCSGCGAKLEVAPAAPVEEAVAETIQEAAPAPAPVPTDDFVQQAPQFEQQPQYRAAEAAPQYQQPQPQYGQAPQYQQPQYGQQAYAPYQQTVAPAAPISARCRTFGIISFVLGICSIVFCWLGVIPAAGIGLGILTIAFGVVGIIFAGISQRAGYFKLAKLGKIFSIIGLCLSAVLWIVGIIITAAGGYYLYY